VAGPEVFKTDFERMIVVLTEASLELMPKLYMDTSRIAGPVGSVLPIQHAFLGWRIRDKQRW